MQRQDQRSYCYTHCTPAAGGGPVGAADNGNIWQIADILKGTRTQDFTYDSLGRISNFSLGGALSQQFQIDSFGNNSLVANATLMSTFDPATNRVANLPCATAFTPYDAAGNQLCSTNPSTMLVSLYKYDAESRISQIALQSSAASPFVSYSYDADGSRVRKLNADGTFTQYHSFGGNVIAEEDDSQQWTDYVFANGQRVVRLRAEDQYLFVGSNQANAATNVSWTVPIPSDPGGAGAYRVKTGDQLCVRQVNTNQVVGGPVVSFSNDVTTDSTWIASDGNPLGAMPDIYPVVWVTRCADLTGGGATTGATITSLGVQSTSATPAWLPGWFMQLADMSIVSQDGTSTPISPSVTGGPQGSVYFGMTAYPWMDGNAGSTVQSAHYFLADHLGSAQVELAEGGWPVYAGQFAPFGQEIQNGRYLPQTQPDGSTGNYKFTGKERDTESGLDYFGARYYGSSMGRWMSPDWSAKASPIPYAKLDNPQSLNLYAYVLNNPLSKLDADGHDLTVTGDHQKDYITYAQKASGLTLAADKNGKISITGSPKEISALGKSFTKLINDANNHASISAEGATSKVFVGQFDGNGHQTLNFQNINALDGKGGFTGAAAVTHETFEAYTSSQGMGFGASHANGLSYEGAERTQEGAPARTSQDNMTPTPGGQHFTLGYSGTSVSGDYHTATGVIDNVTQQKVDTKQ